MYWPFIYFPLWNAFLNPSPILKIELFLLLSFKSSFYVQDISPLSNIYFENTWDFPGGTVGKSPPANAGDTGSSPGPGKILHTVEQLSPCATTTEPALQSPYSATREATAMRSPRTTMKTQCSQKIKFIKKK